VADLNRIYAELEEKARERLGADGIGAPETTITRSAQMRYVGQTYEVDTDIPNGTITKEQIASIADAFHNAHRLEYGVSSNDFPIAFVALGVTAVGRLKEPPHFNFGARGGRANGSSRDVYFDGHWVTSSLKVRTPAPSVSRCVSR